MLGSLAQVPSAASGLLGSLGITGSSFGGLGNSIMNALGLGNSNSSNGGSSGVDQQAAYNVITDPNNIDQNTTDLSGNNTYTYG
jgi:hypothetical protein